MYTFFQCLVLFAFAMTINSASVSAQSRAEFKVVINHEEQYSIWPKNKRPPEGWQDTKITGSQGQCQDYIKEVWTDMRPLTIQKMELPDETEYVVVINHEEQYAIWPKNLDIPVSWKPTDFQGTFYPCVKYIRKVWTDMRPLSLRKNGTNHKY